MKNILFFLGLVILIPVGVILLFFVFIGGLAGVGALSAGISYMLNEYGWVWGSFFVLAGCTVVGSVGTTFLIISKRIEKRGNPG